MHDIEGRGGLRMQPLKLFLKRYSRQGHAMYCNVLKMMYTIQGSSISYTNRMRRVCINVTWAPWYVFLFTAHVTLTVLTLGRNNWFFKFVKKTQNQAVHLIVNKLSALHTGDLMMLGFHR
jgi:hypothetical protein